MIQEGAGIGRALLANQSAFERWALRPRVLVDVSRIDTTVSVLGAPASLPLLIAPSGLHDMSHPDAELATARAARAEDTVMVLSAATSRPMAEVRAAAGNGTTWFQFYWGEDRDRARSLVRMAQDEGCEALVLTVDMPVRPVLGGRLRSGVEAVSGLRPMYVLPRGAHIGDGAWDHDPRLTWSDLAWLRDQTSLPLVLKGIMTREDTTLAVEHGVDAIIVSNHGGRALDTPRGTLDALPEVVEAAQGRLEVYLDGGVRRGHDVVVALALGARAVLIGRPVTWGLAVDGEDGVRRVVDILRRELVSTMGMIGAASASDITRSHTTAIR
jgi:4-hydroxymandelate oxidase